MSPIVSATSIERHYRQGRGGVHALRGVTFAQSEGEFVVVNGESGSGKSTLLNLLGCIDVPDKGTLSLFGIDVSKCSDRELSKLRMNRIGFIFQDFHLIPVLTAVENVAYAAILRGDKRARQNAHELLEQVGLAGFALARPNELSGGQMQRVAIARALAGKPQLLLADEPTANLDTQNKVQILSLIDEVRRKNGAAVLLVSHDTSAGRWADRVITMRDGLIVSEQLSQGVTE